MGPLRTVAWLFGVGVSVSFAQPAPPGPGSYPAIVAPPPQPPQPPQPQPPHTSQIKPPAVADESFCKVLAAQQDCPAYTDNGCKSTKEAIEGSVSGTVWLRESVNLTQTIERKGPLTLFGCNQTWTCTDTARTALTVNPRDETTDTNITIIDITVQYCLEQGLVLKGTNVEIRDSEFRHNGGNPENRKLGVCVAVDAAQALVKDCVFYENSCSDDSAQRGGGLYMAENGRLTVSQSVFVLNHCAAGGGIFSKSPAVVTDCIFSNNTASRSGGAFGSTSSLVVRHSKFVDNGDSQVTGGAIFVYSGFDMTNCTLLHNVAEAGGGVFTNDGDVFIRDSKFKDNKGVSSGGAVYCNGGINATNTVFEGNSAQDGGAVQALLLSNLTACTFTKNAAAKGGAVYLETGEGDSEEGVAYGPTLRDCVFNANTAEAEAGAVYVNGGPLTAINSTFEDNAASGTAKGGGAVQALSGGTIKGCSFVGNSASEGHGGALNAAGNITIINTRFIDNDASVGGAISIDDGSLRLEYSSMTGNKANSTGGAVAATGEATLTVVGSRAAENYAGTKGGAFYCLSQMAVTASTFMCNRAGQRGGAFDLFSLNLNLARDVIITSNSAPSCPSHTWGDGLSCISGANNTCKCKWGQEEAKRLCAGHGTCTNNNNTGAISCACSSGYFLNDTKCTACSTCGQSPVLHPCVPTVDTVCACPDGKTGRGCNQTCQLPPNCSSGDTSKCAFSQFVFHQNVTCTQCQPGYFVGKNGSCKKCSGCGSNGWQKAACTATTDTVCRCPMGRTGDKCEALCEQPEGCAALVWEMINNCTYDAEDYSKGVPCLACRHGYYLGPDNHCSAYTTCNKGQYEKVPPTNSTDRVCAYLTLCGATQYERIPPTPTSDRVCANCSLASDCTTVVSACNATNDLVCKQPCKDGRTGPACQYQVVSITLSEDCGTFTDAQATEYLKQLALALKVNQSDMVLLARSCGSVVLAVGMPDSAVEDLNNRAKNGDSTLPGGIVSVQPSGQPATIITRASTETDSSLPVGVIVGIVAASLVAVVAAIVATYFWYQGRSQIRRERDKTVDALIAEIQKKYKWTDANSVEASKKLSTVEHTVGWLPRSGFAILDVLGRGAFGHVSRGVVFVEGAAVVCAVKQLIPGDGTQDFAKESENFLREAQMLRELDHPNIVRMIGASMDDPDPTNPTGGSVYMLLEFMDLGDLKSYLQHNVRVGEVVSLAQRLWFCQEIARGLSYLASIPIVHRDIAARNVLLRSPLTLGDFPITKISDMGLARIVGQSNYVKQSDGGILPVRWMAPETLASQGVYSEASDVWGFAVCVWEIFSDGAVPFEFCDNTKFLAIQRHAQLRLNKPALCPENVYNVTAQCWEVAPEKRPTFAALKTLYENFFRTECPNYGEESMGYDRIVPASSARVQAAMGGLKPAKGGSDGGYSHLTEGSDSGQAPLLHKGSIRGSSRRGGYSTVTEGVNPDDDYVERTGYVVIEPRRNPASDQSATETPEHSTAIMMTERERSSSVGQRRTSITAPPPALPKTRGLKPTQSGSLIEDDKANLLGSKSDL